MTSRYIQSEHCLQELVNDNWPRGDDAIWEHDKVLEMKAAHRNARKLRCSSDFKGEDGKIYEEGKDYKVKPDFTPPFGYIAIPIQSESEDEQDKLWKEVDKIIHDNWGNWYPPLKQQFIITRRGTK